MKIKNVIKIVYIALFISGLILSGVCPVSAQQAGDGPVDPAEVEDFLDGLMDAQMAEQHVPGATVVVVRDGQVVLTKGYGYADIETRTPVDAATTLFRVGSVSKLFVWTAVMQLVERGELSLDEDVNTYIDFLIPAAYPEPITLRSLMSHTAGFEDKGEDLFKLEPESLIPLDEYLRKNQPERVFAPGEISAYSNYGTSLAGYIVERVSGMPFHEYAEKNIFAPLEMSRSTFLQPLPPDMDADLSSAYNYVDGDYIKGGLEYVVPYPVGALSASSLDMAHFMIAHLQNGRYYDQRILEDETARLMHSQSYSADARITGMAYGFFENTIHGQRILSHNGDTMLFHSSLYLLPEQNVGVFISTNATGGAALVESVMYAFLEHYCLSAAADLTPTADFSSRAKQYTGQYQYARNNFTSFEKFFTLFTLVFVTVDGDHVLIDQNQYVETEPGLLVNREHPNDVFVLKEKDGRVFLHHPDPTVTLIKSPWHAAAGIHMLIFMGGALLFLGSLIGWGISFLSALFRKKRRLPVHPAWLVGRLFGLTYLIFLVLFLAAMMDLNPAYGVPDLTFETPDWFLWAMRLPLVISILGLLMPPLAIMSWMKRLWMLSSRLYYTLLTVFAVAILWALIYWNMLL